MASILFNPLKFVFIGVLFELSVESVLFVTQGGLPNIKTFSFKFVVFVKQ